ncbi:hypothetical protein CLG96_13230 [Sphingomonas oleivorans]|uniref:Aspartyl/asparaginy/proline hydroxylase domain-containing protein n=1 Tax=Sphingomonas oleivorans TaxID=1735121 RepID=A0A2T5FWE4_9SPHN|nr:aspartyl/asparaginyl beta-hydroxylase domain-containing protein [Sphingomonas oleivorans]PTQ10093.1 hypothetical protein CLG96_13230 [Sphingomonas oleivorans]
MDGEVVRLLAAAGAAQRAGQLTVATRHYEAVLEIAPEQPQALNSLGILALGAGDVARAVVLTARAAEADPSAPALWLNLAKAQRALGDDEAERASLERALKLDPYMFMALVRKAELHERLSEDAQATQMWQAALAMAPSLGQITAPLEALLARARNFVETRGRLFATTIKVGLTEARRELDGAELRRFDACIDHLLGRRSIFLNQCAGLHFPFLPADEFFERRHFPWLGSLEAATDRIRAELEHLLMTGEKGFAPYVAQQPGIAPNKWSELDHSTKWSAFHLWQFGLRIEEACARCPETATALDAVPRSLLPGRAPNAFFSVLRPRTRIPPHTGVTNIRAVIHLPLIVPEGCGFRVGGETRQWRMGEAFAFDDTIEHEAWNDSDEIRAVLILDVWNPHLSEAERAMLRAFYATADASGHNPEPLHSL